MKTKSPEFQITHFGPRLEGPPVVSVLMITYNHEAYIREAIESVFSQVTGFPIELVIGEDCSTDGTRQVIEHVCANAPIQVRMLTAQRNAGMHENFRRTLESCTGKYIALLEGDDYWINCRKLEMQFSEIDGRPDISIVFHRARVRLENSAKTRDNYGVEGAETPNICGSVISFEEYYLSEFIRPTASLFFRASEVKPIPQWVDKLPFVDNYICLKLMNVGKMKFLNLTMSVYRITSEGVSAKNNYKLISSAMLELYRNFYQTAMPSNKLVLYKVIDKQANNFISQLEIIGSKDEVARQLMNQIRFIIRAKKSPKKYTIWLARIRLPALYRFLRKYKFHTVLGVIK